MADVNAYFEAFDINDLEERENFVYLVKGLDAELLKIERRENEEKAGTK